MIKFFSHIKILASILKYLDISPVLFMITSEHYHISPLLIHASALPTIITLPVLIVPQIAMIIVLQGARETSLVLQAVPSFCRCVQD